MNLRRAALLLAVAIFGPAAAPTQAAAPPPELPEPTFQSVSKEVLIPMDDGVRIAATLAFPSADGQNPLPGPFPVVLGMTPYGRNGVCGCFAPDFFATRGMVGAVADVRGTGGSEGNLEGNYFSPREARDGYQLVEYLGTQPWSSGKVGMAGGSYVGITQFLAAGQRPPHLAAITPQVAVSDLYREGYTHGGIPNLSFDLQYIAVQGAPGALGPNSDPFLLRETLSAKLGQSPPGAIAFDYLARPNDDQFYRDRSPITTVDAIEVPALVIGGWRDGLLRGSPEMYQRLARRPGVETRLYLHPCTHKGCGPPFAPLTDPEGIEDISAVVFEFLDKHLRGAATPDRPPVQYYLQPAERWATADRWPPAGTAFERLELGPGSLRPAGDGSTGPGPASAEYVSDPAAGFSLAFNKYGTVAATPYVPTDQRLEGAEGLTFRTEPVTGPLDLVGPLALHLVAASTAGDTDWYAKLADVAPDGSESLITEGALRASHRRLDTAQSTEGRPYHPHTAPEPIEPNRFYGYDIEIWPTAYRLAEGHRLQLRLTSTDLPTHLPGSAALDRNRPQEARVDLLPPATNTVRFADSYLVLPTARGAASRALRARACLARRSPIGPRNIGRVRLGFTRRRLLRLPVAPVHRTRRSLRYCVKGSRGRVAAVFARRGRRARVSLVVTTARTHGNRRIRIGSRAARFGRAYPTRLRIGRGLFRAGPHSRRIFGLRRGRVRFIAVAAPGRAADRRALRRGLAAAGL